MNKFFRRCAQSLMGFFSLVLLYQPMISLAAPAYIASETPVALRAEPSHESPVLYSGLTKGTEVNVLEISDDKQSCLVKLADGSKGWMSTRDLRRTAPVPEPQLAQLDAQSPRSETRPSPPVYNLSYADLLKQNTALQKSYDTALNEIERLKEQGNENLRLEKHNDELDQQNQQIKNELAKIATDMDALKKNQLNTGLLYGALIFLVGYLLGYAIKARNSRRNLW